MWPSVTQPIFLLESSSEFNSPFIVNKLYNFGIFGLTCPQEEVWSCNPKVLAKSNLGVGSDYPEEKALFVTVGC